MWDFFVWSIRLRRVEYRVGELPIFLIPIFLTRIEPAAFQRATFWEGLMVFFFLFAFGDLINCLADRDLDAIYKPHLTEAVYGLGFRGVLLQIVLSGAAAVAIAVHLAWLLDRWFLLPMVLAGLVVAWAYSAEPVRLKGRGLGQLAFYWLGLFIGPMIFSAMLFTPWPGWGVWAVSGAYGVMQTGVLLINTAEDFPEDRQMGVRTVIVALGLANAIPLAALLAVLGSMATTISFFLLFQEAGRSATAVLTLLPLLIASGVISGAICGLGWRVRALGEPEGILAVKASARWVPLWITSLALANLLAAATYCFGSSAE